MPASYKIKTILLSNQDFELTRNLHPIVVLELETLNR